MMWPSAAIVRCAKIAVAGMDRAACVTKGYVGARFLLLRIGKTADLALAWAQTTGLSMRPAHRDREVGVPLRGLRS